MLKNLKRYLALYGVLFVVSVPAFGQYTQSSYSIFGIGDVNYGELTQNSAMGGFGLSYNSPFYVNTLNPALLGTNRNAVFHIGSSLDFRKYSNGQSSYNSNTGGFKDFAISLPIKYSKWNLGVGLSPLSTVKYSYNFTNPGPDDTEQLLLVEGEGGLDEFYISNGFRIGNLHLGARVGFVFGSIQKEAQAFLIGSNSAYGSSVLLNRESFSGSTIQFGALYKLPISENSSLNLGVTYNKESKINTKHLTLLSQQNSLGTIFDRDTIYNTDDLPEKPQIVLPGRIGFGVSYESRTIVLGVDFHLQNWESYRDLNGNPETTLGKSYKIAVGGEFIPNVQNTGFLGRINYRFGVHYEKTPYTVNNERVDDFGISFGTALPLNGFWGISSVNVGTTIGKRGNLNNGLIKENYVRLNLGINIQDVTWFTRQKYN